MTPSQLSIGDEAGFHWAAGSDTLNNLHNEISPAAYSLSFPFSNFPPTFPTAAYWKPACSDDIWSRHTHSDIHPELS